MKKYCIKAVLLFILPAMFYSGCGKSKDEDAVIPGIRVNDIAAAEGNAAQKAFEFEISLDKSTSGTVNITISTEDGSAIAGTDYIAISNKEISFQPGETKKTVAVMVIGNEIREAEKTFQLILSSPAHGFLVKSKGTATIQNDDVKILIPSAGYEAPENYPGYSLTWSDEFTSSKPDPDTWVNETGDGCPQLCGWGNNELQYYTNSSDNLFLQDGHLVIEARKESYSGKEYTSARIKTAGKKSFQYGRIDVRAVLPKGKGVWPAIWMLPAASVYGGWPASGEIDIMELIGSEPSKAHGTVHFGPGPGSTMISKTYTLDSGNFSDGFHVFSLEWKQDEIKWYVDDILYSTVKKEDVGGAVYPFNESFYLLLNVAVGGNWPGSPDVSTSFPQRMIVDYIRVFQ